MLCVVCAYVLQWRATRTTRARLPTLTTAISWTSTSRTSRPIIAAPSRVAFVRFVATPADTHTRARAQLERLLAKRDVVPQVVMRRSFDGALAPADAVALLWGDGGPALFDSMVVAVRALERRYVR